MAELFQKESSIRTIPISLRQPWVEAVDLARRLTREQVRGVIWVMKHLGIQLRSQVEDRHRSRVEDCGECTSTSLEENFQSAANTNWQLGKFCEWCGHFGGLFHDEESYNRHVTHCVRCPPNHVTIIEGIASQCLANRSTIQKYVAQLEGFLADTSEPTYIQGEITLGSTVHVHGLTVNTQYNDSIGDVTAIDVCTKQHVVILHADYTKITVKPENLRISQKRVLSLS